ncbi:Helix-turn-helix [Bacillus sp. OV166]|uniref:helix-turn-helix domain-containing protein n=1 Tax=Bacillus sp. OV166 TaxID=1882763 RepID=UPI000A2AB89E|nr:helix-turn-helix transcriptional regulator [Bacillus sp. OV166]SMQ81526.1 Helix-turn-helix [Bacillus sp. OV166]
MNFGKRLEFIRKKRGLTTEQLGKYSELGAASISRIENGKQSPSLLSLIKLSQALEIDLLDLISDEKRLPADLIELLNVAKQMTPLEREKVTAMLQVFLSEREIKKDKK